ncbi:hypothetical protein [Kocuria sp. U4B]
MTAAKRWAAAGSTATVLLGGLLLGAPAAVAAPEDASCLQASGQFNAALAAAGITAVSVTALEEAAAAVTAAEADYYALVESVTGDLAVELDTALLALDDAEASGDPEAVAAAEAAVLQLEEAMSAAMDTPELAAAEQALLAAGAQFEELLTGVDLDEATADELLGLFKQFLTACAGVDGGSPVVAPVGTIPVAAPAVPGETVPVPAAPEQAAPVAPAPVPAAPVVPAPAPAAPVAVNAGMNIQTAAEPEAQPGAALVAALAAAGIAVPAAAAARMRRLERA